MARYILTSDKFEGSITYGFTVEGYLCFFEVNSHDLTVVQWKYLLDNLVHCLKEPAFIEWSKAVGFKTVVIEEDLSFDRFWDMYAVKRNRIDAERLWNILSKEDRAVVFGNVKAYLRYRQRNGWYTPLYPDTYLNKHWKDEWDKA